mmetsp:Transcript_23172/g.34648  ORF Transcript_23172/g.34648 Transcript_23172/m.34648 type:complete len:101 (-) Transcript_23172:270-572(-)
MGSAMKADPMERQHTTKTNSVGKIIRITGKVWKAATKRMTNFSKKKGDDIFWNQPITMLLAEMAHQVVTEAMKAILLLSGPFSFPVRMSSTENAYCALIS